MLVSEPFEKIRDVGGVFVIGGVPHRDERCSIEKRRFKGQHDSFETVRESSPIGGPGTRGCRVGWVTQRSAGLTDRGWMELAGYIPTRPKLSDPRMREDQEQNRFMSVMETLEGLLRKRACAVGPPPESKPTALLRTWSPYPVFFAPLSVDAASSL